MADKKISELSAVTDVLTTDEYPLRRSGATNKITAANLLTVQKLSSSVLGSPAANFDITSISGTYSHLQLWVMGATSNAALQDVGVVLNNDTSSIYDIQVFVASNGIGTAAEVLAQASAAMVRIPPSSATAKLGNYVINIPFYAGTTFHKTMRSDGGYAIGTASGNVVNRTIFGLWRSTAAITRITLTPAAGNWITGSAFALYGIR